MTSVPPFADARTFWELLSRRADATPDAPMLIDEADRRLTFGEFRDRAERVAAGFAGLGVGLGSVVTWQLPTRIETIVASFALSRLGAVQNPIIPIYREREVGFALRQLGAELVLMPGTWRGFDYVAMAEKLAAELDRPPRIVVTADGLPEGDPSSLPAPPPATDADGRVPIRWVYYTSGTTSAPKGVRHTDQTLIAGGIGLSMNIGMTSQDVGSIAFPYTHIGGPDYIVCMLALGFPAVLTEMFVPADAVELYRRHGVTMAGGSTAFYIAFLNEQRKFRAAGGEGKVVPSLRVLSGGGAPKPPEVFYEIQAEMDVRCCHGYGMTECPMIAQGGPQDTDDQLAYSEGAPVHRCEITIWKSDDEQAAPGDEGEVRLAGPMLFQGYTDDALNADAFDAAGRFRTGDLGLLRPDGHITLTGRIKDIIIRKGENVSAKEVEDILYAHAKVGDVAVVGLPDRERGERVCAVVETAPGAEPLTFAEMVDWCRQAGLMTQKIPEQLVVRSSLPRNATLKILKYQLRDELKGQPWP